MIVMNRWLVSSACMLALTVPAVAAAQTRDSTMRTDTTYVTTKTDTVARYPAKTDTTYRTTTTTTYAKTDTDNDHDQRAGFELKGGVSWGNVSNRGVLPGQLEGRNGFALGVGMFGGSPVGFGIEG